MNARSRATIIVMLISLLSVILAACAAPGAPATPETLPVPTVALPTAEAVPTADDSVDLRQVAIEAVQVEVGVGSPIPVDVIASGTWPDLCAQVALVEQHIVGSMIAVDIFATPAEVNCPPDQLGLPFRIAVPLNMVELPGGTYSVVVNGVETAFAWDFMPASGGTPAGTESDALQPLSVAAVTVQVGTGSPIPVEVVASGTWPNLCSQLAEVQQEISGNRIEISLLADSTNPNCPPDMLGIPFRVAVPLNMVEMPLGEYSIVVNGVENRLDWTGSPSVVEQPSTVLAIAYIGLDGNLWIVGGADSQPRQITGDATPLNTIYDPNAPPVSYYFPAVSSDGQYVAVRRDAGTPVEGGMQFEFGLWVYDTQTGEAAVVLNEENPPAGIAWKPDTHLLTYGKGSAPAYFTARGVVEASLATGVYAWDLESGESRLLVEPERGYTLMLPTWSPDGRYLSFDEIMYMEGRQPFAYFDFETSEYFAFEEPLGYYDWSPDGSQIAYDRLTYTATGEERIYIRDRISGEETQISPDLDLGPGYAFYPVFSPDGSHLAFFANLNGPEAVENTLYVQELPGGERQELGVFESAQNLQWSPDGTQLIFSAGPYEAMQVIAVKVQDGSSTVLGQGYQPSVAKP